MSIPTTRRGKEIFLACDSLWAQTHKLPTGDAIAEHLLSLGYKKGSPNERYRYRKQWQAFRHIDGQHAAAALPALGESPVNTAMHLAEKKLAEVLRTTKEKLCQREEEMAALKEANDQLRAHAESLQAMQQRYDELKQLMDNVIDQLKNTAIPTSADTVLHQELVEAKVRIDTLKRYRVRARADLKELLGLLEAP